MNCSENITKVAAALVKVQAELEPVKKDANNPFFKSRYASLSAIWDMIGPILTANGLAVTQLGSPSGLEMTICLETVLMHSSGEWISGEITVPLAKADPQGVGSAITYCRRYGVAALLGIITEDDDDGNAASRTTQQQKGSPNPVAGAAQIDTTGMTPAQKALAERKALLADPVKAQEAAADDTGRGDNPPDAPTPAEEVQAEAQAASPADLLSAAQMTMLKKAASDKGIDLDMCSLGEFDVPVADISKAAATKLLAKIKLLPNAEGSTDNAPYMTPTHTGDPNKLPGMENAFGGPTPVPPAAPVAAPPVTEEEPDPADKAGMTGGFGDDASKKATPKQLATLAKISAKVGVGLTDMISQEFIDVTTPDQLSKKGASHLIDEYTPD